MSRYLLPAAAAVAVVLGGYAHGVWTGRWGKTKDLDRAVARLRRLPDALGEWQGAPGTLDKRAVEMAGFSGYALRRYTAPDGRQISVLLGCGSSGPVALHSPDICYTGAGFEITGPPAPYAAAAKGARPSAAFLQARFTRPTATGREELRILWSWSQGGAWVTPDNPRTAFAGSPALYKLYVIQPTGAGDERRDEEALERFVARLLPALGEVVSGKD